MADFSGKVVIVTGGALGMGGVTSEEFARHGASVVVADLNLDAGEAIEGRIRADGNSAVFVDADVADSRQCETVVDRAVREFGGVDVLFNNVGIQPPTSYLNVEDTPEEPWDRIIGVNLKSHFLMSKFAIPEMRKRGGGVIINNASVQGLQSQPLVPAYLLKGFYPQPRVVLGQGLVHVEDYGGDLGHKLVPGLIGQGAAWAHRRPPDTPLLD